MKLSIKAELVYAFAQATQVIAIIEASHTSDQKILSESLDIQPPALLLFDKTPYGDRSIRASFSGEVAIRYQAVVENNLRQLLPAGRSPASMVGPSHRRAPVSPAQPLLPVGQVHAICATRVRRSRRRRGASYVDLRLDSSQR
ncbi:hypothetical protein [Bradyrhizobium sp. CSA112]|uniref:hypothetical protein n=1 Tax=Bradyrhizobium sp. CSA112 TaxID=2699170 RepID=UPI0023AF64DC|nr:hypothetical protein [Bradyrhizobium sp. CSA112]